MAFSLFGILAVILEAIRPFLWLIAAVVVIELLVLFRLLGRRGHAWRKALRPALLLGGVVMVVAVFIGPWLTSAGFADLVGLLDWLSLIGGSIAAGLVAALLFWPVLTLVAGRSA
ncbi:MAG: DUF5368 family protein [Wenzhouxiangella sp.]